MGFKFDNSKDEMLEQWSTEAGLQISVKQYNKGVKKLQIGPRVIEGRDDHGTPIDVFVKAGRLTQEEVQFLAEHLSEIQTLLS